jgi:hypothetical protein
MQPAITAFTFRRCGIVSLVLGLEFVYTAIRPLDGTITPSRFSSHTKIGNQLCSQRGIMYALRCQGGSAHFFGLDSDEWSEDADAHSSRSKGGNSSSTRNAHTKKKGEHKDFLGASENLRASTASVHFSLIPKTWKS